MVQLIHRRNIFPPLTEKLTTDKIYLEYEYPTWIIIYIPNDIWSN